jgi:nucleoid DNA-binding protein
VNRFAGRDAERLLVERCGLTWTKSRLVWSMVLAALRESLLEGRSVSFSNLGTLTPYKSNGRRYKHPETGQITESPPKVQLRLKLSRNFKDALQNK